MRYISMFSGIEAASAAVHNMGWEPVAFSEIEPFPCSVLAHHYPHVPNVGDMTKVYWEKYHGSVDLVCGGSPCQAFSIAGLRQSLDDDRGNLTLEFMRACHAIKPRFIMWENVPGVFSAKGNPFGCFLAGLCGYDTAIEPVGGKWSSSGFLRAANSEGYNCAWRVLDAQHFGVPQRRQRIFLVASLGEDWWEPCEILFERDGVRGNTSESGEAREEVAGYVGAGVEGAVYGIQGNLIGRDAGGPCGVGVAENAPMYTLTSADQHAVAFSAGNSANARGIGYTENGTPPLRAGASGTNQVPTVAYDLAQITSNVNRQNRKDGDPCPTLAKGNAGNIGIITKGTFSDKASCLYSAYGTKWNGNSAAYNGSLFAHGIIDRAQGGQRTPCVAFGIGEKPDVAHCLRSGASKADKHESTTYVCHGIIDRAAFNQGENALYEPKIEETDTSPTIVARGPHACFYDRQSNCEYKESDVASTISARDYKSPTDLVTAFKVRCGKDGGGKGFLGSTDKTFTLSTGHDQDVHYGTVVRRLTPLECERLQGFPDNWTNVPHKGKPASDAPRYKALGNSWAVPCARWIFERMEKYNNGCAYKRS